MAARYGFFFALLALTAACFLSCNQTKEPPAPLDPPPAPQLLAVNGTGNDYAHLSWYSPTDAEDGFYLYSTQDTSAWAVRDTFPASSQATVYHDATGLTPGSTYYFRVTAFNGVGQSAYSNTVTAHTTGTVPPLPPVNIQATAYNSDSVRVSWTPVGTQDGFQIQRHMPDSVWSFLANVTAAETTFNDASVMALTSYYYRVASRRSSVYAWSIDSALVTTPDGPPEAPDTLFVSTIPGLGARLTWVDASSNETGFHIARNHSGQPFYVIDSVGANVVTYFDSLGDSTANYNFRVRAFNSYGNSPWTTPIPASYDLCSDGAIPLCVGNWWQYLVTDTVGADYAFRRNIRSIAYPGGVDYYLTTAQVEPPVFPEDTLYYLRNFYDGCWEMDFPIGSDATLDHYYKYPASIGQFYYADDDCVLVAGTGINMIVHGTLYSNVYSYQRFMPGNHTLQTFVEPVTVGVVREEEYVNGALVVSRDLTARYVLNSP